MAGSVTPKDGSWAGSAGSNGLSFQVSGNGSEIARASTSYDPGADCGIPIAGGSHFVFSQMAIRDGGFHGTFSKGELSLVIHGQFDSPREASGKIVGDLTVPHNALPPCHATRSFKVELKSGG